MVDEVLEDEAAINTGDDEYLLPGMLSSPHIAYCVEKYKIIDEYEPSCIGSATYNMRIGGHVIIWENEKKVEFTLGAQDDKNKNIRSTLNLRPNSLTFITTIESFNLPKDIIARFNLKSKWVHRGLILGTGPIVDPELKARLLIPLHNFSNQNVAIKYAKEIISVEFTKTLNPDDSIPSEKNGNHPYKNNENRIFNFYEYVERAGDNVKSSVSSTFDKFQKQMDEQDKIYKKLKTYSFWGTVAFLLTFVIGLSALLYSTFSTINDANKYVSDATMIFKNNESYLYQLHDIKKIEDIFRNDPLQNKRIDSLSSDSKSLALKNISLMDEISALKEKMDRLESLLKKEHDTAKK